MEDDADSDDRAEAQGGDDETREAEVKQVVWTCDGCGAGRGSGVSPVPIVLSENGAKCSLVIDDVSTGLDLCLVCCDRMEAAMWKALQTLAHPDVRPPPPPNPIVTNAAIGGGKFP